MAEIRSPGGSQAQLAYRVKDAASRLGLGRSKLYELISKGEIVAFKVGRNTLITEGELKRFVTTRITQSRSPLAAVLIDEHDLAVQR